MLNLCGIVVAIFKMATGRKFSMSGINSGHHNLPTYEMALKSDNVEFVRYCGGHFENGDQEEIFQCQESIRDIIIYSHI
jgi:5-carboxymethyl-2-hydroxymuconate isomerase